MLKPSNLQKGQEQHEMFTSRITRKKQCQYDYRTEWGVLFSTVAPTLEIARERRDKWLLEKGLQS